ncbi:SRPBCC family protein [Embleya sp. NPDC056575]|uniref:SRPBCC family protein n=1 Tax=unclassified Embleya TaxID=2699296 RepID=UPI0036AAAF64
MSESSVTTPLFEVAFETRVGKSPAAVYAVLSDLPRCREWSEECTGGEWVEGAPGAVGSVFRGENFRRTDVVSWAPVVRGVWHTHAEVVAAEPGRRFRWAMRTNDGRAQDSVWGFDIAPAPGGSALVHTFRMGTATEGIRGITAEMTEDEKKRFFAEWGAKLEKDMAATVARLKKVIEAD